MPKSFACQNLVCADEGVLDRRVSEPGGAGLPIVAGAFVVGGEFFPAQVPVSGTVQVHRCASSLGPQAVDGDVEQYPKHRRSHCGADFEPVRVCGRMGMHWY
jgi:hypothetical protein